MRDCEFMEAYPSPFPINNYPFLISVLRPKVCSSFYFRHQLEIFLDKSFLSLCCLFTTLFHLFFVSVSHGQSSATPYGSSHTASAYLYPAALYPGGSLASYNPASYEEGNNENNRTNNNASGPPSSTNVESNDTGSPAASVGRVRTGGSSVGSEADISSTLSPGNNSSSVRDNQESQHQADNSAGRATISVHRWESSNGAVAAALEAVVGRSSRDSMEHHLGHMGRPSSVNPVGSIHEDVWRPYWITPSTT